VRTACVRRVERSEDQTRGQGPFCFTVDGIRKGEVILVNFFLLLVFCDAPAPPPPPPPYGSVNKFSKSQIPINLYLGLHKGGLCDRRSLRPSKENNKHFKTCLFTFEGHLCPPGSGSRSSFPMRIQIQPIKKINADLCRSGSICMHLHLSQQLTYRTSFLIFLLSV
jgi:hypothetical protein